MKKNYYLILGVTADASSGEIKAAFRRQALDVHPCQLGLESSRFRELQEAYGVLGDSERRRRYDGVGDGYAVRIPLTRFGIENFYLNVLLRVSGGRH